MFIMKCDPFSRYSLHSCRTDYIQDSLDFMYCLELFLYFVLLMLDICFIAKLA